MNSGPARAAPIKIVRCFVVMVKLSPLSQATNQLLCVDRGRLR